MTETDRLKSIKKYRNQLRKLYSSVSAEKKKVIDQVADEIAHIKVTLDELKEDIEKRGAVCETRNGNGFLVFCENPSQSTYNKTIKNYNAIVKTFINMCGDVDEEDDELIMFLRGKQ